MQSQTAGIIPTIQSLLGLRFYAKRIQFFNTENVNTSQTGNSISRARGRGMDFEEVRHYQPGDDVRLIHWPLTARLGKPYTKIYREERERAIYFIVDQSPSMHFGTRVCFKNVLAANAMSLMGWAALEHHQQVGGIIFTDELSHIISPQRSRTSLLKFFNLLANPSENKNTNQKVYLNGILKHLLKKVRSGSVVIIISDFMGFDHETTTWLKLLSRTNEVIHVFTYDPLERNLPNAGSYTFGDGNSQLTINADDKKQRQLYAQDFEQRLSVVKNFSKQCHLPFVSLATNDDLVKTINHGIMRYGY